MRVVEGVATIEDTDAFVATLSAIGDEHGCAIQALDADLVVDREHLASAVRHADRAFERGENVARERAVEILCYAAGRRQIEDALSMGVDAGEARIVAVVDGDDESGAAAAVREHLRPAATLDQFDERAVRSFFGIGEAELAATSATLADLVLERVALLDVEK